MNQLGIERAGIPTVTVVTDEFKELALNTARSQGAPDMALVEIKHLIEDGSRKGLEARAETIIDDIVMKSTSWKPAEAPAGEREGYYPAKILKMTGSYDDVNEYFFQRKWTDAFPIVLPTREKVKAMLAGTSRPPDKVIMKIPPRDGGLTVEAIAINAVMAGCKAEYMPVLVSAFETLANACKRNWDLRQIQLTTNPVSILVVVSGALADEIGVNSGPGLLGPGYHANAVIGRAFQTILRNVGGAHSPSPNHATHGQSGAFSMCIAEKADNPWDTLRVQMGFDKEDDVVILFPVFQRRNVNDHWNLTGKGILTNIAQEMAVVENPLLRDSGLMVIFGPDHAATLRNDKWDLKNIRRFLYEWGRVPFSRFIPSGHGWPPVPKWIAEAPEANSMVPVVDKAEDILVGVAGGAGKHSLLFIGGYAPAIAGPIRK